jgi:hypothetical protein
MSNWGGGTIQAIHESTVIETIQELHGIIQKGMGVDLMSS